MDFARGGSRRRQNSVRTAPATAWSAIDLGQAGGIGGCGRCRCARPVSTVSRSADSGDICAMISANRCGLIWLATSSSTMMTRRSNILAASFGFAVFVHGDETPLKLGLGVFFVRAARRAPTRRASFCFLGFFHRHPGLGLLLRRLQHAFPEIELARPGIEFLTARLQAFEQRTLARRKAELAAGRCDVGVPPAALLLQGIDRARLCSRRLRPSPSRAARPGLVVVIVPVISLDG